MVDAVVITYNFVIATIAYACQIGVLSVALSLNFITDEIPNYTLGAIIGTGHLISWTITKEMGMLPYIGLPVAFLVGGMINVALFFGVIERSVRVGRNLVLIILATIGVEFIVTSFNKIWWFWIVEQTNWDMSLFLKSYDMQILGFSGGFIFSVVAVSLTIFLIWCIPRLNVGRVFVALSENTELVSIQGINVKRVKAIFWFISGGLACLTGAITPFLFHSSVSWTHYFMTAVLAGSFLGGVRSLRYALVGGFGVGVVEFLFTGLCQKYVGVWVGEYRPFIPILILALVMYFAPKGILSKINR